MCFGRFLQKPAFSRLKNSSAADRCSPVCAGGRSLGHQPQGFSRCSAAEPIRKEGTTVMRLDKFLKVSRLIKRRTVANEACDAGKVTVNGKTARASYDVKVNDILENDLNEYRLPWV